MLVTAEEAGKKICPMRQEKSLAVDSETEAPYLLHIYGKCLGPECMAWKWWGAHKGTDKDIGRCGLSDQVKGGLL